MHEGIKPPNYRDANANAQQTNQRGQQASQANIQQAQVQPAQNALDTQAVQRPARKPFGSMQLKLAHEIRAGFHGHWFNDTPGRIGRAQEAGYEHVKDKDGKNMSRVVGVAEGGGALTAFLMEIPEEWYQADMQLEQSHIDEKEELMRRGKFEAPEKGYVGQQGITIRQGTGH